MCPLPRDRPLWKCGIGRTSVDESRLRGGVVLWAGLLAMPSTPSVASPSLLTRLLFGGTVFLGSFLLFLVEPLAAKQLLPILGGSSAVWITCLVFFQSALLCGYAVAHLQTRFRKGLAAGLGFGLIVFAAATSLYFAGQGIGGALSGRSPVLAIFTRLSLSIGLPFLLLSTTSPLLQFWWTRLEAGPVPYRLFALSNLASLLALGLYPTAIEPNFTLQTQRMAWAGGFLLFALLLAVLSGKVLTAPRPTTSSTTQETVVEEAEASRSTLRQRLLWLLLPMGAAMQLSAVTAYITANIAAIPLLWILPLAVYLITLILAFQFPGLVSRWLLTRLLVVLLASLGYMLMQVDQSLPVRIGILFFLLELFLACLFCHDEAHALRPKRASESTLFYLIFAAGGALGSLLVGVVAPLVFRFNLDLPATFFVTATLVLAVVWPGKWSTDWGQRLLWSSASMMLLVLVFLIQIAYEHNTTAAVRNFYGSLRVKQSLAYPGAVIRILSNGNIQHGSQIFSSELSHTPTTYYAHDSGVGLALDNRASCCTGLDGQNRGRHIGVIGLGTGTIAAYGKTHDQIHFYEINPAVEPIARNLFTYMRDAQARGAEIAVVDGDARTSLAQEPPQNFDVLVIDAFSGDAIPLHLLTTQALALYQRHLAPGGVLAFHISNQHVDLEPEVALLAQAAGMTAMRVASPTNEERGEFSATWMLVSADPNFFRIPAVFNNAKTPRTNPRLRLWTDDYSSLLPVLNW